MNTIIGPSRAQLGFSNLDNIAWAQLGPAINEKKIFEKYFF